MLVMPTERDAEAWSKDRFSPMARDTPVPRRQDLRPEVARRLEQDPAQALPGRAPDHRRRQRALGAREPADPHPALRRGRPLSVQRRRRGRPGQPREEAHGHLLEPQDRAGLDPDDPRPRAGSRPPTSRATSGSTGCRARAAARTRCWSGARSAGRAPAGEHRPETARYHCVACDAAWSDALRWAAIRRGEWRARAPFRGIAGFHLNEIYSSWVRLEAMVARLPLGARPAATRR